MTARAPRWPPDPGLAVERTALAWRRTTLSAAVALAASVHAALTTAPGPLSAYATAATAALTVAAIAICAQRRTRQLRQRQPRSIGALTVAVAVATFAALTALVALRVAL
ncbi:DUF202 domain-containing protein [Nocardia sp. NPDC059239]|uniref:DUF202 domain-containing protein n=1 Tax=unclassified Nocardia TaxID=2637762 RepID=UPI003677CF60